VCPWHHHETYGQRLILQREENDRPLESPVERDGVLRLQQIDPQGPYDRRWVLVVVSSQCSSQGKPGRSGQRPPSGSIGRSAVLADWSEAAANRCSETPRLPVCRTLEVALDTRREGAVLYEAEQAPLHDLLRASVEGYLVGRCDRSTVDQAQCHLRGVEG